ncbi:DUF423 domain-containing protein [Maribrevibacterium harenarium]|uniref:DUF423 domain-containing protein n=2 Tax=Maribrevibacterium harenarium TaxID=2589817 RepID=A0A501X3J2_9GAMM|nr:DUF423 domain-containing protein [Maribrevibacterium harenarium]
MKQLTAVQRLWGSLCALQAGIAVAAGAFGAHGLKNLVDERALGWWQTGSQYLMYHALAGLIVVAFMGYRANLAKVTLLFTLGSILFTGSLYVMTLTSITSLGMITPLGGVTYLSGWGLLAYRLWRG